MAQIASASRPTPRISPENRRPDAGKARRFLKLALREGDAEGARHWLLGLKEDAAEAEKAEGPTEGADEPVVLSRRLGA